MSGQPAYTPASGDSKQPGSQVHTLTASHWTMCISRRPPTTHYASHPGTPCALVRLMALQSRIIVARTIVVEVHQDCVADAVQLLVHKPFITQDKQRTAVCGSRVRVPHNTVRRVQLSKLGRRGEGGILESSQQHAHKRAQRRARQRASPPLTLPTKARFTPNTVTYHVDISVT